jgi:hypothetical protein
MDYKIIEWDNFFTVIHSIRYYHSLQTLVTMSLGGNLIKDQGMSHLQHEIRKQRVRFTLA